VEKTRRTRRDRGLIGTLLDPVVWVFLLAGTFEVLTGEPTLHATLLFAVAAVLVVDAVRRRVGGYEPALAGEAGGGPLAEQPRRLGWVWVVAGIAFAVVVGTFRRYTWPVTLTVWAVGAPAVVWAWRVPPRHRADRPLPGRWLLTWVGLFVGLAIWELVSLAFQPSLSVGSPGHPTISTLTNPLFAHSAGRIVALAAWLAVGWYLLER
jgi:hypothetical protein